MLISYWLLCSLVHILHGRNLTRRVAKLDLNDVLLCYKLYRLFNFLVFLQFWVPMLEQDIVVNIV
uniref:Uncharacterized protein n=1 Tax=Rhizophora mucronata TaxID=61149 RepID=A0A2P2NPH3_RHIMU